MVRGLGYQNRVMRSIVNYAVPITMVAAMSVPTVLASMWMGRLADKVDTIDTTTKKIEQAQYTQADAAKDLALVHTEIGDVRRRVEVLETAQHRQAVLAQNRVAEREARNDDFVTRASKWLSGKH
jgi:hypothetical protein